MREISLICPYEPMFAAVALLHKKITDYKNVIAVQEAN